jgi:hypothetical protein
MNLNQTHSDALVFFGATGDLAYKKIFPSLQAMVRRGRLNVPVIGVALSGWTVEQFGTGQVGRVDQSVQKQLQTPDLRLGRLPGIRIENRLPEQEWVPTRRTGAREMVDAAPRQRCKHAADNELLSG